MWVKICGNTNLQDALMAAEMGADAVGFVFAPSRRRVEAAEVARIVDRLPAAVETVGVFPSWHAAQIEEVVCASRVGTVQLHGGYNADLTRDLEGRLGGSVKVIQVAHWERGDAPPAALPPGERILVDSKVGAETGGTGVPFDWEAARGLFLSQQRMILAGGLRAENVAAAIELLRPWGVDVASGVEASPGRKDRARMERFFAAVRSSTRNRA
jgi:phosphoribosylanthranilate isomerase